MSLETAEKSEESQHNALVDKLRDDGTIRTAAVETAMRTVPRHVFVPEADTTVAYADETIPIYSTTGEKISIASQPGVIAAELEAADIQPGMRVLEIGAGTGYNAALLGQLVGQAGHVTTIDIHSELVNRANKALAATGAGNVTAVLGDGDDGAPGAAPFDRILATVGVWDISPAWIAQLAEGGLLIVPLRIRGYVQRVTVFERRGDRLVSLRHELSIFMPMEGVGAYGRHTFDVDAKGLVKLELHTEQQPTELVSKALIYPWMTKWTGVTFATSEPFDGLALWLACHLEGWCQLEAGPEAVRSGLLAREYLRPGKMAFFTDDAIGFLPFRKQEDGRYEVGVGTYGPDGGLVAQVAELITRWDREYRDASPVVTAYLDPAALPADLTVFARPRTPLTVEWPSPVATAQAS